MPITPLHFGVLAPINHFAPGKVHNGSFMLVNLLIDVKSILFGLTGYGAISHDNHSFIAVIFPMFLVGLLGLRSHRWWWGAFWGAVSHIALDMLVHADMSPFEPFLNGNPAYLGLMEPLSVALLALCAWLTLQYVSDIRGRASKALVAARERVRPLMAPWWR